MNWISVKDSLPEMGVGVLCFHAIGDSKHYYIAHIYSITSVTTGTLGNYIETKSIDWLDGDWNSVSPTHWCVIDEPK